MSNYIFLNNPYTLTQNADIYGLYINEGTNYDYIFSINIASLFTTSNNSLIAWYQFNIGLGFMKI